MKVLVIHKDSTKYIIADVQEADVSDFLDQAYDSIKKQMNDPEIPDSRISVFKLQGECQVISAQELNFIKNPPSQQPAQIVTHGSN